MISIDKHLYGTQRWRDSKSQIVLASNVLQHRKYYRNNEGFDSKAFWYIGYVNSTLDAAIPSFDRFSLDRTWPIFAKVYNLTIWTYEAVLTILDTEIYGPLGIYALTPTIAWAASSLSPLSTATHQVLATSTRSRFVWRMSLWDGCRRRDPRLLFCGMRTEDLRMCCYWHVISRVLDTVGRLVSSQILYTKGKNEDKFIETITNCVLVDNHASQRWKAPRGLFAKWSNKS